MDDETIIRVRAERGSLVLDAQLREGELLLLHQAGETMPLDPGDLKGVPAELHRDLRRVPVDSRYVSRKHVLVWRDQTHVHVRDLYSTHGTSVSLPPWESVAIPRGGRVDLHLADTLPGELAPPAEVDLQKARSPRDFVAALTRQIDAWRRLHNVPYEVTVARDEGPEECSDSLLRCRVAGDHIVEMRASDLGRTTHRWFAQVRDVLRAYVRWQNSCFVMALEGLKAGASSSSMIVVSDSLYDACWKVALCAVNDVRVIFQGETGVGKSVMARRYHEAVLAAQQREDGEFVVLDCSQYDDKNWLRAELYGAGRGVGHRPDPHVGALERARGGTLFLDEIGELPIDLQAQLLLFLDSGRFTPLFGEKTMVSDARIICGTREDLRRAVADKRFREDLWYRLAGMVIQIPPLRERADDVAARLTQRKVKIAGRQVTVRDLLDVDARDFLEHRYDWPGNFRELDGFCDRLPIFVRGGGLVSRTACEEVLEAGSWRVSHPSASPTMAPPAAPAVIEEHDRDRPAEHPSSSPPSDRSPVEFVEGRPRQARPIDWSRVLPGALRDYAAHRGVEAEQGTELDALLATGSTKANFKDFVEGFLKPWIVATAIGIADQSGPPENLVREHWAAALGFKDGTSIRDQLKPYFLLRRRRQLTAALAARGFVLSHAHRQLLTTTNPIDLDRWTLRAETAARVEDVFRDD